MLTTQLDAFELRLSELPADRERALAERLATVRQQADDAESAECGPSWSSVQDKIDQTLADFASFEEDFDAALD